MSDMSQIYYRYGNVGTTVVLSEYEVAKRTPKGVRLVCGKLVIDTHLKRFAYPTVEEAKVGFLARKRRQLMIVRAQLQDIEAILARTDPFENAGGDFTLLDFELP